MKTPRVYLIKDIGIQEPRALREIHDIRLQIAEETKNMTSHEFNNYVHKGAQTFFECNGIKPLYVDAL
jgi:hypothetical protein